MVIVFYQIDLPLWKMGYCPAASGLQLSSATAGFSAPLLPSYLV